MDRRDPPLFGQEERTLSRHGPGRVKSKATLYCECGRSFKSILAHRRHRAVEFLVSFVGCGRIVRYGVAYGG